MRTPYPSSRMSYEDYLAKYSKGDTMESGLSEDELYEFERELFERCLEVLGCDFERMNLFHLQLVIRNTHDRPNWVPVPVVGMDATEATYFDALKVTEYNLSVAHSEFQRAWRGMEFYRDRQKEGV